MLYEKISVLFISKSMDKKAVRNKKQKKWDDLQRIVYKLNSV